MVFGSKAVLCASMSAVLASLGCSGPEPAADHVEVSPGVFVLRDLVERGAVAPALEGAGARPEARSLADAPSDGGNCADCSDDQSAQSSGTTTIDTESFTWSDTLRASHYSYSCCGAGYDYTTITLGLTSQSSQQADQGATSQITLNGVYSGYVTTTTTGTSLNLTTGLSGPCVDGHLRVELSPYHTFRLGPKAASATTYLVASVSCERCDVFDRACP